MCIHSTCLLLVFSCVFTAWKVLFEILSSISHCCTIGTEKDWELELEKKWIVEIERREQGNGNNPRGRRRKKVPDPKISPKVLHKNPIHFFFFLLPHKFNHSVFWEWFLFHNSISSLVLRKLVGNGSGRRDMELGGWYSSLANQFTRSGHLVWTIRGLGAPGLLNPSGSSQIWTTIPGWSSVGGWSSWASPAHIEN